MSFYSAVNVVVLHEDIDAAIRARIALAPFLSDLKPDFVVKFAHWGLDELQRFSLMRKEASADAFAADIIVVSLHDGAELPAAVREWFAIWAPKKKGRPAAFVALDADGNHTGGGACRSGVTFARWRGARAWISSARRRQRRNWN